MEQSTPTYSIEQLAEHAGVSRRTIRYYIELGLVDRPIGETRAAHYTWRHLQQLLQVRKWTDQGLSLERIRDLVHGGSAPMPERRAAHPGDIEVRSHVTLAAGIELVIEPGHANLSPEQLRQFAREAVAAYQRILKEHKEE
jgi:DNA-binding transcriptional MerR regulator